MEPGRIQLSRKSGWRMPAGVVRVSRPGKWGNPFKIGVAYRGVLTTSREHAVERYIEWLKGPYAGESIPAMARTELRGKTLACWCPLDQPCHADVLLRIANG